MTETQTADAKKSQWGLWLVGALVLVAIALLLIYAERQMKQGPAAQNQEEAHAADSALVSVSDQAAGPTVLVESVDVPAPGVWVVVHELRETELGNALGATRVKGPASDVSVDLLRATEPAREYAVVLYRNNEELAFSLPGSSVYVDFETGERVETHFTTLP